MKILIISHLYPNNINSHHGIFVENQAEYLYSKGHDIIVINPIPKYLPGVSLIKHQWKERKRILNVEIRMGIKIYRPRYFSFSNFTQKLNYNNFTRSVEKLLKTIDFKPNIINAHFSSKGGVAALYLCRKYQYPYILTEHASFVEKFIQSNLELSLKIYSQAKHIITVSNALKKSILFYYPDLSIDAIPNLIKPNYDNRDNNKKSDSFNFLNISSMDDKKIKGLDILLDAITLLKNKNFHLTIVGDGKYKKYYRNYVDRLNINKRVSFISKLEHKKAMLLIESSDCLIISSRKETFSMVGLEAISKGTPVISTKCGGPEDYIVDNIGILVENQNANKLAIAMSEIIKNYKNFNPTKIKKYYKQKFSQDIVGEKISKIFEKYYNEK
tara:strand:+ start:254 stop:1408 length:1155 start_codon:yes stop_codon:yes gene_type:complete